MMVIKAQPLTEAAFAPFGQVLAHKMGDPARHNFAAELFNDRPAARPNLRVQRTEPTSLPYVASMIERHRRLYRPPIAASETFPAVPGPGIRDAIHRGCN